MPFLKGEYKVRQTLWKKSDLGLSTKNFETRIAAHDVLLVRLSPTKISTND